MPIVNRDYLKLCYCMLHITILAILTTALMYPNHAGQRVRLCLYVWPKQREACFTVSDVGGWSPIHSGGLDAPASESWITCSALWRVRRFHCRGLRHNVQRRSDAAARQQTQLIVFVAAMEMERYSCHYCYQISCSYFAALNSSVLNLTSHLLFHSQSDEHHREAAAAAVYSHRDALLWCDPHPDTRQTSNLPLLNCWKATSASSNVQTNNNDNAVIITCSNRGRNRTQEEICGHIRAKNSSKSWRLIFLDCHT